MSVRAVNLIAFRALSLRSTQNRLTDMKRAYGLFFAIFLMLPMGALHAVSAPKESQPPVAVRHWVTPAVQAVRVQQRLLRSAAIGTEVSYHLYTPKAYALEPDRRFPVLYWLHGTGSGISGIPTLARMFDDAIEEGRAPPMLIVFPNGLRTGMWCDAKDGSASIETMVVRELVAEIDAGYRTVGTREGRMIEGFSIGGYGAARLGFRYPDVFATVSMLSAGPLDQHLSGPSASRAPLGRDRILREVYGGDIDYFRAQSPSALASDNRDAIRGRVRIRQRVGERDPLLQQNRELSAHLGAQGIDHDFAVVPGVGHEPSRLVEAMGEAFWRFYREAFAALR